MQELISQSSTRPLLLRISYLDEFVFRFNRRRTRHAAFRALLGIGGAIQSATYKMLI